ncbi:unnamed protein product [Didymodactylos carnosus]|uniref:ABC-2 type transporter transmembrane domain-containing protein n=1 Tax=Didymodactylos carnosus TaxID=1234261 RepID=A0A815ABL0_9BILA|nr:unnamed protein product [Didymodactylos carnosus]CAF1252515.1 unnamed protein product [Didymodactylos carnosus]CAF3776395.1 unnamed protein product [Didymodactylos carnosus]CAF4022622.1 unnamed protein product [Didymodactylos carnosus]
MLSHFSLLGFTCEQQDNPCDFILDIVQGDRLTIVGTDKERNQKLTQQKIAESMNDKYLDSLIWKSVKKETDFCVNTPSNISLQEQLPKKSRIFELYYVSQRILRNTIRKPSTFLTQIFIAVMFAILEGFVFFKIDHSIDEGVTNRGGAIFLTVSFQVFVNAIALQLFVEERVLFVHEHSSGYYHVSTYMISKLVCDLIPLRGLPAILLSIIVYVMIDFQLTSHKFFIFLLCVLFSTLCSCALCFCLSASVKEFSVASVICGMLFLIMMIFSGFIVDLDTVMPALSWLQWLVVEQQ